MAFRNTRCYYLLKLFLSLIGQWPQQSRLEGNAMSAITLVSISSLTILELWGLIAGITNLDIIMENLSPLLINSFVFLKLINYLYNKYKMRQLLSYIEETWEKLQVGPENEILQSYAQKGSILATKYSISLYLVGLIWVIPPVVINGINLFFPTNETCNVEFLYRLEHVIDVNKYFNWLMLNAFFGVFYIVTVMIAVDSMFVVCIQYLCAIFEVIRYNMEHIQSTDFVKSKLDMKDDEAYHIIIECIKSHKHALKFSELLSSAYAMSYLFLLANVTICLSFSAAEIIMLDIQFDKLIRIVSCTIGQVIHLYFISLTSQRLIDYSSGLHETIYNCNWYTISLRCKRLLKFILLRATKPCQIEAGKMYVMSMENFSSVLQVSMSYFTMLTSMQ